MSMEVFREQVIEMVLLERPGAAVERRNRDEIEVRWAHRADEALSFSVGQAYEWYLKTPRALIPAIEWIGRFILISSVAPTTDALTVVVKGAEFGANRDPADRSLTRPIVEGLVAVVVIDNAYGYQTLPASHLRDQLKLDDAALWTSAMRNTVARLEIDHVPMARGEPTELLRGDGLATSLLLVDEFWDPPRQSEALVAAPVAPNKLLVAPERDIRSLRMLREAMRSDPLDPEWRTFRGLLARRAGRWEVLD